MDVRLYRTAAIRNDPSDGSGCCGRIHVVALDPRRPGCSHRRRLCASGRHCKIRAKLGLDQPLYVQFFTWIGAVLQGDLGTSIFSNLPVSKLISQRIEPTLALSISTIIFAVLVAVPMGLLGGALAHGLIVGNDLCRSRLLRTGFVIAYALMYVFS